MDRRASSPKAGRRAAFLEMKGAPFHVKIVRVPGNFHPGVPYLQSHTPLKFWRLHATARSEGRKYQDMLNCPMARRMTSKRRSHDRRQVRSDGGSLVAKNLNIDWAYGRSLCVEDEREVDDRKWREWRVSRERLRVSTEQPFLSHVTPQA